MEAVHSSRTLGITPTPRSTQPSHTNFDHGPSRTNTMHSGNRLTCEPCRERKVKCNRMFPECNRCARLGYKCTYRDRVSHRASQAAVIQQLQERMSQAEARLAQQEIAMTPGESSPIPQYQSIVASGHPRPPPSSAASSVAEGIPQVSQHHQQSQSPAEMSYSNTTSVAMGLGRPAASFGRLPASTHQEAPSLIDFDFSTLESNAFVHHGPTGTGQGYGLPDPLALEVGSPALEWSSMQRPAPEELASPYHFRSVSLVSTDESAVDITSEDLGILYQIYFDSFAIAMPILYKERFYQELRDSPNDAALQSVSYTISLLAILISEQHRHLEPTCYRLARRCIDRCETDDESKTLNHIRFFQSILLLTRYEMGRRRCTRAAMLMGRAARLAKILRLEEVDKELDEAVAVSTGITGIPNGGPLRPARDFVEIEERRRCLWALYILDGYSTIFTGSLGALDDEEICVLLPSPGSLDSKLAPARMPTLPQARYMLPTAEELVTPYTGLVLVVFFLRKVFQHTISADSSRLPGKPISDSHKSRSKFSPGPGFWDRHYSLVRECRDYDRLLHHLSSPRVLHNDTVAFNIHLTFCAIELRLWDAALDEAEGSGLPNTLESMRQIQMLAVKIGNAVRSNWTMQRMACDNISLSGAFVAWPLCMAIKGLNRRPAQGHEAEKQLGHLASNRQDVPESSNAPPAIPPDNMDRIALLQLLCAALDEVEVPTGPWHESIASFVNLGLLQECHTQQQRQQQQ